MIDVCPHCGERISKEKGMKVRSDWYLKISSRLSFLRRCDCELNIVDIIQENKEKEGGDKEKDE